MSDHKLVKATQQINNNKPGKKKKNSTFIEKLPILLSHIYSGGTFLEGLFPGMRKEEKHVGGMKQQQAHLHPPGLKSPPSGIHKLYPYPQAIRPSPPRKKKKKKGLFLKMLVEEASAVAIELLLGSQGWIPVSDVMHSLIS